MTIGLVLPFLLAPCLYPQNKAPIAKTAKPGVKDGQTIFTSSCAGCHGLDGLGTERAPDISHRREIQKLSDADLFRIVHNGVPGTGMPAFHALSDTSIRAVVGYVRILQGKNGVLKVAGDPAKGKALFFGKAACSECHMSGGRGGFLGPDLSSYGATHSIAEIRQAMTAPGTNVASRAKQVLVVTQTGRKFVGIVRNEDNFSLQLQDSDGVFHLLMKADLEKWEYQPEVLTGPYHQAHLSPGELDDLTSFIVKSANPVKRGIHPEEND
ncbi:MAG TPA: c-type cytochrome [Terriglobales bacterium]|nr:c-type cytochrome [Terriglobales bacterium]